MLDSWRFYAVWQDQRMKVLVERIEVHLTSLSGDHTGSYTSSSVLIIQLYGFTPPQTPTPLRFAGGEGLLTTLGLRFEVLRLILMPETTRSRPYNSHKIPVNAHHRLL
jgi:hypothetical protein